MVQKLTKNELGRNVVHMFVGLITVLFINLYPPRIALLTFAILLILGLFISILSRAVDVPIVKWVLNNFDRPEDVAKFPGKGALFFILGSALTLMVFGVQIASASILILAVGDSLNILIGQPFGKIVNPLNTKKMFEGSIAGFVGGFIVASFFVPLIPAMIAAAVAMMVEMIDFGELQVNDNVLVPLASGLILYLLL